MSKYIRMVADLGAGVSGVEVASMVAGIKRLYKSVDF